MKITAQLSEKAEGYFNELMASLEIPDGDGFRIPTISEAINETLEAHCDFEEEEGINVVGWLENKRTLPNDGKLLPEDKEIRKQAQVYSQMSLTAPGRTEHQIEVDAFQAGAKWMKEQVF